MAKLEELLDNYGVSHKNATNKLIHWVAVPAIMFSILGLVWSIPFPSILPESIAPYINWATILIAATLYYYYNLSPIMAFSMILVAFGMSLLVSQIEVWEAAGGWPLWLVSIIIFVVAWIFQFIGHKIEGQKPSFLEDVQYLLIGPLWLIHFIFKKLGIKY